MPGFPSHRSWPFHDRSPAASAVRTRQACTISRREARDSQSGDALGLADGDVAAIDPVPAEIAGLLLQTATFLDVVQGVAELAARAVPRATTCGITLNESDRIYTVASADALANLLDERQYELEVGPCLEALVSRETVQVEDFAAESRWDGYPQIVLAHGIRSSLSVPMVAGDRAYGAVNLYSDTTGTWDAASRQLAELITGQATIAVTAALRSFDETTLSEHLRTALRSRTVIDQAIGVIMGQSRCDADTAFAMLRTVSQRRNVKLRTVAAELIAGIDPPPTTT